MMKPKAMYVAAAMTMSAVLLFVTGAFVQASSTDDRIEASARNSYVFTTYLKDDDVSVQSREGVVTLNGTVTEDVHKSLAQETVASLPGVKSVDNRLTVTADRPAEKSDAWLTAKVKTTLLFHRNVSALTEVATTDGIVTLRGNADNQAQKDLTTEYAKDVDGVKDVKNEMTVSKSTHMTGDTAGEQFDDASITAQVKIALLFHRSTSALGTEVETQHGVVTLKGTAKNAAEKDLVSKLVNDIKGVKSVKNTMTIEKVK